METDQGIFIAFIIVIVIMWVKTNKGIEDQNESKKKWKEARNEAKANAATAHQAATKANKEASTAGKAADSAMIAVATAMEAAKIANSEAEKANSAALAANSTAYQASVKMYDLAEGPIEAFSLSNKPFEAEWTRLHENPFDNVDYHTPEFHMIPWESQLA